MKSLNSKILLRYLVVLYYLSFGFGQDDYVLPSSTTEYISNAFRSFNWTSFLPFDYVGIAALQIKIYEGNGTLFVGLGDIQANFSVNVSGSDAPFVHVISSKACLLTGEAKYQKGFPFYVRMETEQSSVYALSLFKKIKLSNNFCTKASTVLRPNKKNRLNIPPELISLTIDDGWVFHLPTGDPKLNPAGNISLVLAREGPSNFSDIFASGDLYRTNGCSNFGDPVPMTQLNTSSLIDLYITFDTWQTNVAGNYSLQLLPIHNVTNSSAFYILPIIPEISLNPVTPLPDETLGLIVGLVVGGAVIVVLTIVITVMVVKNRRRKRSEKMATTGPQVNSTGEPDYTSLH